MIQQNSEYLNYQKVSNLLSWLSIDMVEKANSGHPGAPMGMSDFISVLVSKYLNFNPLEPKWINRDRLIFSNGHASALLYSLLYALGYEKPSLDDLKKFRQLGSNTAGHPEFGHLDGVEVTTGPLGQGFANAVGMSIACRKMAAKFGSDLIDHKIYVTMGDGCMMEGISHEAASLAGNLGLSNLVALFDSNQISIDGSVSLADSVNVKMRFQSYGWHVLEADGHDFVEIEQAFEMVKNTQKEIAKPILIIFNTIIGKGSHKKSGSASSHGAPLGKEEIGFIRGQDYQLFTIDQDALNYCRGIFDRRIINLYKEWSDNFSAHEYKDELAKFIEKKSFLQIDSVFDDLLDYYQKNNAMQESTRKSSGIVLEKLLNVVPNLIGGSADLSESNCVLNTNSKVIDKQNLDGNFLHYGVREHAMVAINNGIACYEAGLIPFAAGFLIFSDYAKPAIRLNALMGLQALHILTHDSIGLGEDGPTHQPVEQLSSFRAMPNLLLFRPADAIETLYAYRIALENIHSPSVLALSRQNLPQLSMQRNFDHLKQGAYIVSDYGDDCSLDFCGKTELKKIIIFATGSELSLALSVKKKILAELPSLQIRVISMFCTALFDNSNEDFKNYILDGNGTCSGKILRVAIEAACQYGWHKYIGLHGLFFGVNGRFGASGKIQDLYNFFGLNEDSIVSEIKKKLN